MSVSCNPFPPSHTNYSQNLFSYINMLLSMFFIEYQGGQYRLELRSSLKEGFLACGQRNCKAFVF